MILLLSWLSLTAATFKIPAQDPSGTNSWNKVTIFFAVAALLLETLALVQKRLGLEAARDSHHTIIPLLNIEWIGEVEHHRAMETLFLANRRRLSLVDCASFLTMRRLGIRETSTFDTHFAEQGFVVIP